MEYTLNVRAFFDIKKKERADIEAARLFPELPVESVGRYWKDKNLWEFQISHVLDYRDDMNALWNTLVYFRRIQSNWLIIDGPNDGSEEVLISAVGKDCDATGLTWCGFEVWRGNAAKMQARGDAD